MARKSDIIRVESDEGVFDAFHGLEITNDIVGVTEARFDIGDDNAYGVLLDMIAPGAQFKVYLNDQLRMTGRSELVEVPMDPTTGVNIQLVVRPKLTDAFYSAADATISVQNTSVKKFVLACYEQLGYTEQDFVFDRFADVELLTGQAPKGKTSIDLEELKVTQAKVQTGETIRSAVERHLKRYGATHWDSPDGKIIVGHPDDTQMPTYRFLCKRGPSSGSNNIMSCNKANDWTDIPSSVHVYGKTHGKDVTKSKFRGVATDIDVEKVRDKTGHFNRVVIMSDQQSKTQEAAQRAAQRALSARSRRKDAWDITVDGWTYWDGSKQIPYANNTTADLDIDPGGPPQGLYFVTRVVTKASATEGTTTQITTVAPGIWTL